MNPTAIYSKTGKGVQEASGKTSHLSRSDRTVLAAIDGKATFADLQARFDKTPADKLEALILQLDKSGFVREVSGGTPAASPARPASTRPGTPPPAAPKPGGGGEELDFTQSIRIPPRTAPPAPPPPRPAEPAKPQIDFAALAREDQEKKAKEQEALDYRKRQEAEARAKAEAEAAARAKAEAEARARVEAEARAKAAAEAEAKVKAAREAAARAAAEAKAKAEAEARARVEAEAKARAEAEARLEAERKAREEAERQAREAEERARKEAEEKARREQEELRRQLEAERKAREESERRAREEAERREREEAERKAREEAERRAREAEERARKEAEEKARREQEELRRQLEAERKAREESERRAREEAERRKREEEDRKRREEEEARRRREEEEARKRREEEEAKAREAALAATLPPKALAAPAPPPPAAAVPDLGDSLLADLDSFSKREEEERQAKEEADRKAKEERARRAREEEEREKRQEEEARRKTEEARRRAEEEARRAEEDAERRAREEEERKAREYAERKHKADEALTAMQAKQAAAAEQDIVVRDDDLDLDEVKREQERFAKRRREREEQQKAAEPQAAAPRRSAKWGKPVAIGVFALLVAAVGGLHVMPISISEYEKAASQALGEPVKIGGARLSVITGVELKFERVSIGDAARIGLVRAQSGLGGVFGSKKAFGRIELENAVIAQESLGRALLGSLKTDELNVARVALRQAKFDGPIALPALDGEIVFAGDGSIQSAKLTGPDKLVISLAPKAGAATFDVDAASFAVPFIPGLSFSEFGMQGSVGRDGMKIDKFDGRIFEGVVTGNARVRWGAAWTVEGRVQTRNMNVAVFAPGLLSEGRGEGQGQFSMSGAAPARLGEAIRLEGAFKVEKGVLGSFDLARAVQTGGAQATGRTENVDISGQAVYDRGTTQLRGVSIGRGPLSASALLDVSPEGAIAGRVIGELRTPARTFNATLVLGGTTRDPQLRR